MAPENSHDDNMILRLIFISTFSLLLLACQQTPEPTKQAQPIDTKADESIARNIKAHMTFLADNLLLGRDTGSDEYEIAARYVASQMAQVGLKPGGDYKNWYQTVPFVRSTLVPESIKVEVISESGTTELEFIQDVLLTPSPVSEMDQLQADIVFVGFGIESKELGHNDYENLDVKDKIVLVLTGRPVHFPSEEGAHLGSKKNKVMTAIKHGAIGYVAIHTPEMEKRRKFERLKKRATKPSVRWRNNKGEVYGYNDQLKAIAYLSTEAGGTVFSQAGQDFNEILKALENQETPVGYKMNLQMAISLESKQERIFSSNVVGILEGSDPVLKNEYVVYSAHLDHIGHEKKADGTDGIHNGALDNASGIAVMLETARQFSQINRPARSVLFVAVTAEEKGLLGSSYFATHPTVPVESMVANINLDMPLILYPFADVIAFGAQHSTMAGMVERAAANHEIQLTPDPMPNQALFVRSDHYSFVQQGVPSIFLVPGFNSKDPDINGQELFMNFIRHHYHQPSDSMSLPINFEAGKTFTLVNFEIGREIANSKQRPRWHEGDYFGEQFGRKN